MKLKEAHDLYYKEMDKLNKTFPTARNLNKEYCQKCGFCCWRMCCDLTEENIIDLANHFSITVKEIFEEKLTIQQYSNNISIISAIKTNQKDCAGKFKSLIRSFDYGYPCTFLKSDNTCSIEHIQPAGHKLAKCWKDQSFKDVAIIWNNDQLNEFFIKYNIDLSIGQLN